MSTFTMIQQTVGDRLAHNAAALAEREAAVYGVSGPRWTWADLQAGAEKVAAGLLALGVRRGDHVAIWGTNRPEWLLTQFGAALIGAPLVTINPEWKAHELHYALHQSETRVLIMFPGFTKESGGKIHGYDYRAILREVLPEMSSAGPGPLQGDSLPYLKRVVLAGADAEPGFLSWRHFIERGRHVSSDILAAARAAVTPENVVLIQYTSGTTGFPKGAMLTHQGVVNNALAAAEILGLTSTDRICVTVPYYHCFGSIIVNVGSLVSGAACIVPGEHFESSQTLAAVAREGCTILHGVPTMFLSELAEPDFETYDLSTLRAGIVAGAPCPAELMQDIVQQMGIDDITIGYGLTEASPLTHQTRPDDPPEARFHTVGRPIPGTEARIVEPTTLESLPAETVGEIWVRGYNVMKGYFHRQHETEDAIHDGWLRTGDLGKMDAAGYFRIVGRLKNMIIVGGHNVYPAEVEQTILSLFEDRIEMVQVVGIPHPRLQEVVATVIKKREGAALDEEEIRRLCTTVMEWPKVPRHIVFMSDFSGVMTATGKIQKFKLRELLVRRMKGAA